MSQHSVMYYKGYPYCHKGKLRQVIIWESILRMPFYGLSILILLTYCHALLFEVSAWNILAIIIFSSLSIFFIRSLVLSIIDSTKGRIVLYFSKDLPRPRDVDDVWAYPYGSELAKNLEILDSYLKSKMKPLLSEFGFHDDYWDGNNEWKQPDVLLDSFLCLKAGIDSRQLQISSALENEITIYINKLRQAADKQLQCRLIYRNGLDKCITPMYMEQREGRFP